jgi:hypothetical protein
MRIRLEKAARGSVLGPWFQIVRRADGVAIGDLTFHDPPNEVGEVVVGISLVPSSQGCGLGTEAFTLACACGRWRSRGCSQCTATSTKATSPRGAWLRKWGCAWSASTAASFTTVSRSDRVHLSPGDGRPFGGGGKRFVRPPARLPLWCVNCTPACARLRSRAGFLKHRRAQPGVMVAPPRRRGQERQQAADAWTCGDIEAGLGRAAARLPDRSCGSDAFDSARIEVRLE